MNNIVALLRFRLIQSNRLLKDAGYLMVVIVAFLTLSVISQGFVFILECPPEVYGIAAYVLLILLHNQRKDTVFLESLFQHKYEIILLYCLEYLLVQLPFVILFISTGSWIKLAVAVLSSGLVSLSAKASTALFSSSNRKSSIRFIPLSVFELKFFLERNVLLIFILVALLGLTAYHFGFFFVLILLFSITIMGVFAPVEDRSMVNWSKYFVANKLLKYTLAVQVLLLPAFCLALFSRPDLWIWFAWAYGMALLNLWMFITYKYSRYAPDRVEIGSSNALVIFVLLNFLPGTFIVSLIYTIINYVKAERNLIAYYART